jgi:hypothetical protein
MRKCVKNIQREEILDRQDAQASVQSPSLGSARCIKAGLSYRVIVGSEGKQNDVSRRGGLKDSQPTATFNIMTSLWPHYVGRNKFEAVADSDPMGHRGYC